MLALLIGSGIGDEKALSWHLTQDSTHSAGRPEYAHNLAFYEGYRDLHMQHK